jgi:CBS domain-containing protein/sporulation protein YlmC with PRC-barrel domain
MVYLSQLLNRKVYYGKETYGKITDLAVFENYQNPSISKIVIKKDGKKITVSPSVIDLNRNRIILKSEKTPFLPYDEKDFYLNEDLLDKQVIDIDGKRLVRVNDVLMENNNGETKVVGIDIGFAGLFRRLGISFIIRKKTKILPWQMIEAFDYQTGNVRIKLTQNNLNTLHPSELADILEEAGSKERLGIVESLDTDKAVMALEEADYRTQEAILEQLPLSPLKRIVVKMHITEIADLFYKLNPLRIKEILNLLGHEKAQIVEGLLDFGTDTAGGLMNVIYYSVDGDKTVKEVYNELYNQTPKPETILVTNGNSKLVGILYTKDILDCDPLALAKDIVSERKFVHPNVDLNQIIKIFSQYNLRILPVVDKEKKPIGVVTVDTVLSKIEDKTQEDEAI